MSVATEDSPPGMRIMVRHGDPGVAASTAETIAEKFITYAMERRLAEIARIQSTAAAYGMDAPNVAGAQLSAVDSLSLLEAAGVPGSPIVPKTRQNTFLGGLLGLILALASSMLLAALRDTVRFPEQLQSRFGVASLGLVLGWQSGDPSGREPIVLSEPTSTYAESFRQLRANLAFAAAAHPTHVYLITSPGPSEGKSTVVSNLAVALAQTGKKTLLIDGDMRRPSIHREFPDIPREPGLSNYLADLNVEFSDIVHSLPQQEGVNVIPSGPIPPNPGELLASDRLTDLLDQMKKAYDYVLLDSPPSLPVADASVMATHADGVVLIVNGQSTRPAALQAAVRVITNAKTPVLGVVINRFKRMNFGYGYYYRNYYYYYSSGYGSDSDDSQSKGTQRLAKRMGNKVKRGASRLRGR